MSRVNLLELLATVRCTMHGCVLVLVERGHVRASACLSTREMHDADEIHLFDRQQTLTLTTQLLRSLIYVPKEAAGAFKRKSGQIRT
jgi:hypothetical protein